MLSHTDVADAQRDRWRRHKAIFCKGPLVCCCQVVLIGCLSLALAQFLSLLVDVPFIGAGATATVLLWRAYPLWSELSRGRSVAERRCVRYKPLLA